MKIRIYINITAILLVLTGCALPTPTVDSPIDTVTPSQSTNNPRPTESANTPLSMPSSASPTVTRFPTNSSATAVLTRTATVTPTFTPETTLSVEEAKSLILNRAQNTDDCRLPCLWGFMPGRSDLKAAQAFVEQFGQGDKHIGDIEIGAHNFNNSGGVGISYPVSNTVIVTHWSYYWEKETKILNLLTMYSYPMEIVGLDPASQLPAKAPIWDDDTFNHELLDYLLPSILTLYGQPSQIFVTTRRDEPDRTDIHWYPFSVALVYPEKGIYVEYVSPREISGNNYLGCPHKSHIYLAVWDPQTNLPLEFIVERAGSEISLGYSKSLTEATVLSLEEFYQIFKNPQNTTCLETPIEIWPIP